MNLLGDHERAFDVKGIASPVERYFSSSYRSDLLHHAKGSIKEATNVKHIIEDYLQKEPVLIFNALYYVLFIDTLIFLRIWSTLSGR